MKALFQRKSKAFRQTKALPAVPSSAAASTSGAGGAAPSTLDSSASSRPSISSDPPPLPGLLDLDQPSLAWPYPTPPPSAPAAPSAGFVQPSPQGRLAQLPPLVRPTPVLAPFSRRDGMAVQLPLSSTGMGAPRRLSVLSDGSDGGSSLSVSLDFGTTFSGVSFASDKIHNGQVQQVLNWPGTHETFRKIPTCLVYSADGQVQAWGLEAKAFNAFEHGAASSGEWKCEWFKLFLEPTVLRSHGAAFASGLGTVGGSGAGASKVDPRLPALPPGKTPQDVIADFLACLWAHARAEITRELGLVESIDGCAVWLTVPAAWDARGSEVMRAAAIQAGLVRSTGAGDWGWRDRLKIITEPEAAAVHCAALTQLHGLRSPQTFIVFDGGGGTCDLATYKLLGSLSSLEIAEISARSGASCGSLFLDLRFRALLAHLLARHPAHLDGPSLANFMHAFAEGDKLLFRGGERDDQTWWRFACFNQEDPDDVSCGLINGEVAIQGIVLRQEVFDPVIDQVIELIASQVSRSPARVDALLLVGGFSASEYLFRRIEERFGASIRVIARPRDCDIATVQGAARYGLTKRQIVSSVIIPKSYVIKVRLPAEAQDFNLRPAYVSSNSVGAAVCQNRLQYLAHKGAIVRKGQRMRTPFCKYSTDAEDRLFTTVLYTSDADSPARYTDEQPLEELCRWTVDLAQLPAFQRNAELGTRNFVTEFELGLELDSAEARGVLLADDGEVYGEAVFDFF